MGQGVEMMLSLGYLVDIQVEMLLGSCVSLEFRGG